MSGRVQYTSSNGQRSEVIHDGPELRFDEDPFLEQVQRVLTKLNLTRRKIVRERSIKVRTPERSEETKMKDAVEIATSPEKIYGSAEWKRGTPTRCTHYLTQWRWKRQLKPKPAFWSIDFWHIIHSTHWSVVDPVSHHRHDASFIQPLPKSCWPSRCPWIWTCCLKSSNMLCLRACSGPSKISSL